MMNTPDIISGDSPNSDTTPNALHSALLSSLISGQAGGLDLQSLLAAQAGGGQVGGLDLTSLVAAQAGGTSGGMADDQLSIVMRWLEQRRAAAAQSLPTEELPSEAELELQRLEDLRQKREQQNEQREQARELKHVMDTLYAELETLRARNDTLAAALGACYLCFGEDVACPECGGQGQPGSLLPDAAAFRQYIAPAVNRVRAAHTRTPGSPSPRMRKEYRSSRNQPVATG